MRRPLLVAIGAAAIAVGILVAAIAVQPRAASVAPVATPQPSGVAAPTTSAETATPSSTPGAIPDGYRVQIPRLAIDLPITEGDIERDVVVQQTPENFAFHLPGTAIPGTGGNSYLYAHARRGMFLSLWNARVGDEIIISTPRGAALRYVVREIHPRVPPEDTSWIQPTPTERLTLQTSTGPNRGDPRFVVVATPA
jgi:LPXTG-site transpeptidase (sortase) family protein